MNRKFKSLLSLSVITGFCLTFLGCSQSLQGPVKLAAIFSDNMVLQQQTNDPVWGWAGPGESIMVKGSWDKNVLVKTKADKDGKWMVKIKTPKAGGPYTLTVLGGDTVQLHNVMIGEVWLCSGQSNMEMPVSGWPGASLLNSADEIQAADFPDIRLFTVKKDIAFQPQQDCVGSWSECSPESVAGFSATAYFFGRELYKRLKVPIGLIHSSWGGTVAEAWTSESALRTLNDFDTALDKLDSIKNHFDEMKKTDSENLETWNRELKNINDDYAKNGFNDSDWKEMQLPTNWESAGLPDFDGIVWFRKTIKIPASWAGKDLQLDLGPIDDEDITWFNGQKVGGIQEEGYWTKNRSYKVPGNLVKTGDNVIAVRVTDLQGGGGIYGNKDQMKLYPANAKTDISLAGNWRYKVDIKKPQTSITKNPNMPTVLYNGMIAPIIPFGIKGAIWYQGEANVGRAAQYARLFPTMITDWRTRWQEGDFPFYFVQIAPFPYGGDGTRSAALRDAQRRTLSLSNTGMVVTLDIGDTTNIHPANKEEVGRRLSLWAFNKVYGDKDSVYSGPLYKRMQTEGNKIILSFDHAEGGLVARGGRLDNFQIAGTDGHFVRAHATIEGDQVIVQANDVLHPVAVRYAWRDNAVPHLFNKAGLPASTFTTGELDK